MFALIVAASALDVSTTRMALAAHPTRAVERNPLYGPRPSALRLYTIKFLILAVIAWCYGDFTDLSWPMRVASLVVIVATARAAYINWKIARWS